MSNFSVSALPMDGSCLFPSRPVTPGPCGAGTANFYMLRLETGKLFYPPWMSKVRCWAGQEESSQHEDCLIRLEGLHLWRLGTSSWKVSYLCFLSSCRHHWSLCSRGLDVPGVSLLEFYSWETWQMPSLLFLWKHSPCLSLRFHHSELFAFRGSRVSVCSMCVSLLSVCLWMLKMAVAPILFRGWKNPLHIFTEMFRVIGICQPRSDLILPQAFSVCFWKWVPKARSIYQDSNLTFARGESSWKL